MALSRLRRDIDAGRTGDKSTGVDPAAAPLGTDDEAAGVRIDPQLADSVRAREVRPDGEALSRQNATPGYADTTASDTPIAGGALVRWSVFAVALVLAVVLGVWLLR